MNIDAPLVDVVLVHFNRPHELARSVASLRANLHYPNLRWVVADDYSSEEVFEFIKAEVQPDAIFRTKKRSGLGVNTNNALKRLDSDFVFLTMDDRVLTRPIDLRLGVDILYRFEEFGLVRYGGLTGHDVTCRMRELVAMPDAIFDVARSRYFVWELLKRLSRFLFVYSGQPHLKHRRFHEAYGPYKEGIKLGATEEEFAHRFIDMEKGPSIICFPEFVPCYFDHIGHTWQLGEHDIGRGMTYQ